MSELDPGFARLHEDARRVLTAWTAPDEQQSAVRGEYLAHLDAHADGMSRSCAAGHLTASALVVDASRRNVLLTLHPKVGRWLQLGGHCEPDDASLREAALREAIEESGIADVTIGAAPARLDRHPVPCGGRPNEHLDVQYLAWVADGSPAVRSEESDDLAWFPLDDLPAGLDDAVLALISTAKRASV